VQVVFGLFPVLGLLAMDSEVGFDPMAVAAWRVGGASLLLAVMARLRHPGALLPKREDLPLLFLLAMLGIVANQALYLTGLERSSAMDAGLMMCTIPIFTCAVAAIAKQEPLTARRVGGVALALAGVLPLVLGRGEVGLLADHAVGNLLMAANCLCFAIYLVLSRPLSGRVPALVLITWTYWLSLPALPFFLWGRSPLPADVGNLEVWASLAYVVIFPSILGYLLNLYALSRVGAGVTSTYVYLQPVLTAVAAYWILGELLTPQVGLAAAALFAGVALVSRDAGYRPSKRRNTTSSGA
jgi:drug/metabolite transporter (DMT)-like permease